MARIPRQEIIDETEAGIYHCVQRCVRRAFLCGRDAVSGTSYEHRKQWIRQRLAGIDAHGDCVSLLSPRDFSGHTAAERLPLWLAL